jgi:hypothetical protein
MPSGTISILRVGTNYAQLILKNRRVNLMVHTTLHLKNFEFNSRFRNSSTLKYVTNIIMWIRDTGCYTRTGIIRPSAPTDGILF